MFVGRLRATTASCVCTTCAIPSEPIAVADLHAIRSRSDLAFLLAHSD